MIKKFAKIYSFENTFLIFSIFIFAFTLENCSGAGSGGGESQGGPYSVSGTVTQGSSTLAGVTITLTGMGSPTKTTDSNGAYEFTDLASGSYAITPSKDGFTFNPVSIMVSVTNANVPGKNFSATPVSWAKTYGGNGMDIAHSIQQTSDSGFILTGETSSFGSNTDIWVLKLDVSGNITWQKTYGGNGVDIAHSIQQTSDGGFILAGETSSFGLDIDVWVLKMDGNGGIIWEKRYGGTGEDIAYSIQQTSDGGYILAGQTNSFGAGDKEIWVLRLTSIGEIQWQKTYGATTSEDSAYSVQPTSDGGFIIAGETISGRPDVWILKLDSNGGMEWQKTYGGANDDAARSIQQTSDGGYVIAGITSSFAHFFGDIWLVKLDSAGAVQWEKTYGGNVSSSANSIGQTFDGGYIVTGSTTSFGRNADYWVLRLDPSGDIGTGCTVIAPSDGITTNTGITAVDSSGSGNSTNAQVSETNILPQDTNATTTSQCSSP